MKKSYLIALLIVPAIIYFSLTFIAIVLQAILITVVHIMDTINNKIEKLIK